MDIFRSDKAPYVLALLVTVVGWHVTQLVTEITRTQAVSYSVDINRQTGEVVATIRNVSRTKSLVDATFSLECQGGEGCFAQLYPAEDPAEAIYGRLEAEVPNGLSRARRISSESQILFTNTVAAGGRYHIKGRLTNPNANLNFYFLPTDDRSQRPLDIYLYERGSVGGFVVENYLALLLISLALCLFALIYSIVKGPVGISRSATSSETGDARDSDVIAVDAKG